jgi:hypothetical protein
MRSAVIYDHYWLCYYWLYYMLYAITGYYIICYYWLYYHYYAYAIMDGQLRS